MTRLRDRAYKGERHITRLSYKQALWAIAHRLFRLVWKILHGECALSSRVPTAIPRCARAVLRPRRAHFAN
jgi:hypothetical protein